VFRLALIFIFYGVCVIFVRVFLYFYSKFETQFVETGRIFWEEFFNRLVLTATSRDVEAKTIIRTMEEKTEQIKRLTDHLLKKYGSTNIIVTDYWDGDNAAIGLADKTRQYTVYIAEYGKNSFFVSLENPPTSDEYPYTLDDDFNNLSDEEVEKILVKHLKIA
jgi:uncharacterized membrane protein